MTREKTLTDFQRRTLQALLDAYPEGMWHEKLYPVMFPKGRFITAKDHGSTKGGPSRIQCAVNWHLGKFGNLVRRREDKRGLPREWTITTEGRKALREQSA